MATVIETRINNRTAIIGIMGLGYVGLPLAVTFAEAGFYVIGYDIHSQKIESLSKGISYVEDVENERLAAVTNTHIFTATGDINRLKEADAVCICVPTPLTKLKDPVVSFITGAAEDLSRILQKGQLIILESTTYPGTTREVVLPILEQSGLKAGQDFYLVFSPERVDPTNKKYTIKNTPKLVGGYDPVSTTLACQLYSQIVEQVVPVSSMEAAETTKLFENCFRLVNIAYVNEFAELCEKIGVSIWEIIDNAKTKPFGYMPFYPGPGIGGHCIPVNPYFLFCKAREHDFHIRFLELATGVNEQMPYQVVSKIIEALSCNGKSVKESSIFVLGASYKKDVGDLRGSPSLKLIELLLSKGAAVTYNDPFVNHIEVSGRLLISEEITPEKLSSADCIVIATDHSQYDYQSIVDNGKIIFDTRGITRKTINGCHNVIRLGEGAPKGHVVFNSPLSVY